VTTAPNAWLRMPEPRRAWLKLLAGHEATSGALGVKILARFPEAPPGQNLGSLVALFDDGTGFPLALLDGVYITAARTGAGAALAAQAAAPDARRVALVGTGVVGWYSLAAMAETLEGLESVVVTSRSAERRQGLARRIEEELGLRATAEADLDAAAEGADVLITATNAPGPVVAERHLPEGGLVLAMGIRHELEPAAIAACRVVPDGLEEAIGDGKFSVAIAAGAVTAQEIGPQLGAVLAGDTPVRAAEGETVLFDSSGVAVQDIVCARAAWLAAEERDVGVLVDLAGGDVLAAAP
jgi:ornithine cyclodeaminase/alanine dehydrogenase-like protein (mu-crystallin family)